jgi:hypothetical protein
MYIKMLLKSVDCTKQTALMLIIDYLAVRYNVGTNQLYYKFPPTENPAPDLTTIAMYLL